MQKIAILSSIAYNEFVDFNRSTQRHHKISLADMQYAEAMDSVIKPIGVSRKQETGYLQGHHYKQGTSAGKCRRCFQRNSGHGDAIGDAMFYGRGAGSFLRSAVIAISSTSQGMMNVP